MLSVYFYAVVGLQPIDWCGSFGAVHLVIDNKPLHDTTFLVPSLCKQEKEAHY